MHVSRESVVALVCLVAAALLQSVVQSQNHGSRRQDALPINPCPQCLTVSDRHVSEQLKLEAIKQQILSKLNLNQRPNMTVPVAREVLLEAFQRSSGHLFLEVLPQDQPVEETVQEQEQEKHEEYYGKTSEIIVFSEPGEKLNENILLDFYHPQSRSQRLRVASANLWIQLRQKFPTTSDELPPRNNLTLYVFQVDRTPNSSVNTLRWLQSHDVDSFEFGWQRFNLLLPVREWFSKPESKKLTLLVDCSGCGSTVEPVLFTGVNRIERRGHRRRHRHSHRHHHPPTPGIRPFLTLTTEPIPRRRTRRYALTCNAHTTQCCKQSLWVSFKQLNWDDWIMWPRGYSANYCVGECGRSPLTPDLFPDRYYYSQVLDEYRRKNPFASITPCCAPTKLTKMSIVYIDGDRNIYKADLPNMKVEECGCT
ncbi:inhibin beta chain-like [Tachypleus tridentatus]|uniref:inhibin beta chain-like n=1 Tax=Tachypleus tridentatus TaxID=6853 RepID=UPI003FD24C87